MTYKRMLKISWFCKWYFDLFIIINVKKSFLNDFGLKWPVSTKYIIGGPPPKKILMAVLGGWQAPPKFSQIYKHLKVYLNRIRKNRKTSEISS